MNWLIGFFLVAFAIRVGRGLYVYFYSAPKEFQKVEVKLRQAEAKLMTAQSTPPTPPIDKAVRDSWIKKVDTLTERKEKAEEARNEAKKQTGWWQAIVQSNNFEPIWLGLLVILCFFATVMDFGSLPFEAPWEIKEQYAVELALSGKDVAEQWLSRQQDYPFPHRERRFYRLFGGWGKTFLTFLLFLVSIPWAYHDEVHAFFAKRKKEREGKESKQLNVTEVSLMALIASEALEWFHRFTKHRMEP